MLDGVMDASGRPIGLWGKAKMSDPKAPGAGILDWHPLAHHSLDVAACFMALCETPGMSRVLSSILGRNPTESDMLRLTWIAFLHDFGKGNPQFQRQITPLRRPEDKPGHIREAVGLLAVQDDMLLSFARGLRLDEADSWFEGDDGVCGMLVAAWSHHGKPISPVEAAHARTRWSRKSLAACVSAHAACLPLFEKAWSGSAPRMKSSAELEHWFCGLLQLADWMGSNDGEEFFPYSRDKEDLGAARWAESLARARLLVADMGLGLVQSDLSAPPSFSEVFGFEPRAAQKTMASLPLSAASTVILEAETGSGKTEAALFHFLRMLGEGHVNGLYFALPTRTSGVQIHGRVHRVMANVFGARYRAVLAIPGYVRLGDALGRKDPLSRFSYRWSEGDAVPGWLAESAKRFLAAPIAVGTVDQALASVLRGKHAHMRMSALTRSLLVVDEVHASDEYMSGLLARLLERHRSAGGSSLLMSATLGQRSGSALAGRAEIPPLSETESLPYPLVSVSSRAGRGPVLFPVEAGGRTKCVRFEQVPSIGNPEETARMAALHASRGARVLVLRNTVGDCQATKRHVEALLPPHMVLRTRTGVAVAHHGRYAPEDRRVLDALVEGELGYKSEDGSPRLTKGMVVVGTQTLEQSLDIDADILITDACPMDVLLQRVGRLHRGMGIPRPAGYEEPACIIQVPPSLLALDKKQAFGLGRERAYPGLAGVELTLRLLAELGEVRIPEMNRMLVERTTHPEALSALGEESSDWRHHIQTWEGARSGERGAAREALFNHRVSFMDPAASKGWDDEGKAGTRLGESPVMIGFATPMASPLGEGTIRGMAVPPWMFRARGVENPVDTDGVAGQKLSDSAPSAGFVFEAMGVAFRYDADGLSLAEPKG